MYNMAVWEGNWFSNATDNVKVFYASNGFDRVYKDPEYLLCFFFFLPDSLKMSGFVFM